MTESLVTTAWLAVAAVTLLAGFARGLAGFGVGLMMMPVTAYFYSQQVAVPIIALIDIPVAFTLLYSVWGQFNWREVAGLFAITLLGIPPGIALLLYVDPYLLRVVTSVVVLLVALIMLAGFRLPKSNSHTRTGIIGFLAGLMEGSMSLPGPPIIFGWVATELESTRMRANIILYFSALLVVILPAFWISGLFTTETISLSLSLMPLFSLAALVGAKCFSFIPEAVFSRIILGLIMFGAISSLFA
ncbi:MAG: sulfite exporter TauE/SafE family protein [Gammaproteobacteria bacterium]|nr:sulfite exporter TauE/SafE family protein [Gammaproteobacteria bacterium]